MFDFLIPVAVGLHVASAHVPRLDDQNNINPGAYVLTQGGFVAGAYHNTLRRTSIYAGHISAWGPVDLAVGVVTGYRERCTVWGTGWECRGFSRHAATLMIVPSVRLPALLPGVHPRISYVPRVGAGARSNTVHVSIEYSL